MFHATCVTMILTVPAKALPDKLHCVTGPFGSRNIKYVITAFDTRFTTILKAVVYVVGLAVVPVFLYSLPNTDISRIPLLVLNAYN